jgi:hypothetical protein
LQPFQDSLDGHGSACPVILVGRSLCPSVECGLDAPERDSVSHSRFDEVGQGFALSENGLEFSAQLWLDADLRYDSGLHQRIVLRLRYARNGSSDTRQKSLVDHNLPFVSDRSMRDEAWFGPIRVRRTALALV